MSVCHVLTFFLPKKRNFVLLPRMAQISCDEKRASNGAHTFILTKITNKYVNYIQTISGQSFD